jgi:signal transduction histidine kinase
LALGPDRDDHFVIRAERGLRHLDLVGRPLDASEGLLPQIVQGRAPMLAERPAAAFAELDPSGSRFGPTVAVPLQAQDRVVGVLVVLRAAGRAGFAPGELPLLTSFAEQAALTLELGEKNRAQRQLDVLADRDRIARDLHDHVIQRLFATGLQLQGTLRRLADPRARERVEQAVADLDETVRQIRTSIFELQVPVSGAETGLRRRLLDTAVDAGAGLEPTVRISGPVDALVDPGLGAHAVAVVREAVSNAVRHGRAEAVTVTINAGDELLIDVLDNGVGIDPTAAHSGLGNLRQRAEDRGGEMRVRREPGGGTRLSWRVPLGQ